MVMDNGYLFCVLVITGCDIVAGAAATGGVAFSFLPPKSE